MSYAPLSPLDPSQSLQSAQSRRSSYKPLGRQISLAPTMTRSTKGTDFFSAVYLSTTDVADDPLIEASIKLSSGGTKPLRVRKKNRRIAGLGPASRHRRSNISVPRSPRSSMDHSVSTSSSVGRSNTSSSDGSSVHPHQSISRIFMAATPILESPPVLPSPTRKRNSRRQSLASSIHSDLIFRLPYDDTPHIGPSPPSTPIDSPAASVRRSSTPPPVPSLDIPLTPDITTMYRVKPLPMPPSPVTPSRAPSKAAKLLGADAPHVPKPQGVLKGILKNGGDRAIKRDHYRPLPVQTLQEIEQFFGDVPKKSTKLTTNSQKSDTRMAGQRNLGLGSTVRHKGEDGATWLDQQEEQEFAWLMSEVSIRNPSPIPTIQKKEPPKNAEPQWPMDNFTSVLSIKPTYSQKPRRSDKKANGRGIGESFMDFGPEPSPTPAPSRPSQEIEPWQDAQLVKPSLKDTISAPMAQPPTLLQPPPRMTSHARSASLATPPVDAFANRPITPPTQIASGRLSPPRNKKRPPPLFLHALPKNGNLPAISDTPRTPDKIHLRSVSEPVKPTTGAAAKGYTKLLDLPDYIPYSPPEKQDESLKPTTPFVKPRRAPIPGYHPSAAKPQHTRYPSHGQTAFEEDISFFEPVTPTDSKPSHKRGFSNEKPVVASNKGVVGIKTGGWFRRVVKAQ